MDPMDELERVLRLHAQHRGNTMRWSNFLLTISTNVTPRNFFERVNLTNWLETCMHEMFRDFEALNGRIIKPAGSDNSQFERLPNDGSIAGIRVQVSVEQGDRRGFMHAHVLIEICHHLAARNEYGLAGVHLNRQGISEFMNSRINQMDIMPGRRPEKIYINCRLLTRQTDNSAKWMTLAYINKDRDVHGRDLNSDRRAASDHDRYVAGNIQQNGFPVHQI